MGIFSWNKIFQFSKIDEDFLDGLEDTLILSDFGGTQSLAIMEKLRVAIKEEKIKDGEVAKEKLKSIIKSYFLDNPLQFKEGKMPVICFIGINGVGKTTTLAKVAQHFREKYQIVIGAADTYRAAASLQLEEWGRRLELPVISKGEETDAAAVAFDSIQSGLAKYHPHEGESMVLIDTAGRLHNKENLIEQLGKLIRVCDRFEGQIDRRNFLILDATLGQIGLDQIKIFLDKVGVDGIILTKIDTQSKGGVVVSISEAFSLPIYFVTFGESPEQIKPFSVEEYLDSLF